MRNIIKKLFVIFSISIFASCITVNASAAAERFQDVPAGSWCYSAIDYAVSEHQVSGIKNFPGKLIMSSEEEAK